MKTESPDRDPTWLQSLPNEALRCLMKHMLEVPQGFFRPEIQGALQRSSADKFSVDKFHQTSRVTQRFTTAFKIACDSLAAATAREQTADGGRGACQCHWWTDSCISWEGAFAIMQRRQSGQAARAQGHLTDCFPS